MRIIFLIFLNLIFFINCYSQNDETTEFIKASLKEKGDLKLFLAVKIEYPFQALKEKASGQSVISLTITKDSLIDSIKILKNDYKLFGDMVVKVLKKTNGNWIPTKINGNFVDYNYLVVVNYFILGDGNNKRIFEQFSEMKKFIKDYEAAISYISQAIELDPYDEYFYLERRNLRIKTKDLDGILSDNIKILELSKTVLVNLDIVGLTE